MKLATVKTVVSQVIADISSQGDNEASIRHVNGILLRIISCLLLLCALITLTVGNWVCHLPRLHILTEIVVFAGLSVTASVLARVRLSPKAGECLVAVIYNLAFFYVLVRYYDSYIGPMIWTVAFVLILISVARIAKTMLLITSVTLFVSALYLRFFADLTHFPMNAVSAVVQIALFGLLFAVAYLIYGVNVRRLKIIGEQLKELETQIGERKRVEDENIRLALYDHLTGLPNRLLLSASVTQAMQNTSDASFYVMFIDIDGFKRVNDTMGHACGDELIKQAGDRISAALRSGDSVGRVGGDEFLALIHDMNEESQISEMANRVLEQFSSPFVINAHHIMVSCSIGIAKYPEDGADVDALMKSADFAMYRAKQDGKNRYKIYSLGLAKEVMEELDKINALQQALAKNEFVLYYQPQIEGTTHRIIGYEALIRWNHPERGIVSPGEFIPLAEKTGLIIPVGEWVLRTACRQNKQWHDMGLPKIPVSVNVSTIQMNSGSFFRMVREVLAETSLEPEYLKLEITESAILNNGEIRAELEELKKLGVKIAIDDFGTGYSVIQYLRDCPVDCIKIPMSFVHGISLNKKDEAIINVILALAQSLHIDVIAEGVESESQYEFLKERACFNLQGFLFYPPMPADGILKQWEAGSQGEKQGA